MFNLKKLEVVYWDYWNRMTVPLEGQIVALVGTNGSGKTTFIDACRTLLGIECSMERDYKRYVRRSKAPVAWLRGVVNNSILPTRQRAFYPLLMDPVTLVCRIKKSGGEWERKYAILAGDVEIETIESRNDIEWIGIREYGIRMQEAGLTPAMRKVLALDQGATDKLAEYSGRELLRLVFDTFGDQDVLNEYEQSKREYQDATRQLEDAQRSVDLQESSVLVLKQKVDTYREWVSRRDRLSHDTDVLLPVVLIEEKYRERRDSLGDRRLTRSKLRSTRKRLEAATLEHMGAELKVIRLEEELTSKRDASQRASTQLADARVRHSEASGIVKEKVTLEEQARLAKQLDLPAATRDAAAARQKIARLEIERENLDGEIKSMVTQLQELRSGKSIKSRDMEEFRSALDEAGIKHVFLADIVDVTEAKWRPAIEGILGSLRAMVILRDADDQRAAYELGLRAKYRNLIAPVAVPATAGRKDRLLSKLSVSGKLPAWLLRMLDEIHCVETIEAGVKLNQSAADINWVTPEGYYKERRGGRYAGEESRWMLGEAARRQAADDLEKRLRQARERLAATGADITTLGAKLTNLESAIAGVDAGAQLMAQAERFAVAEQDVVRYTQEVQDAGTEYARIRSEENAAVDAFASAKAEKAELNAKVQQQTREESSTKKEFEAKVDTTHRYRAELRALFAAYKPEWRDAAVRKAIIDADQRPSLVSDVLKQLITDERKRVEAIQAEVSESAEFLYEKNKQELDHLKTRLEERKQFKAKTLGLVDEQRAKYINVLRSSAMAYQKHVRKLAEIAGVKVDIVPPAIENTDESINHAALNITFTFDDKESADVLVGDSSGGQRVIKSMILLIALMMDDDRPAGVVFIDEPFAHLDIVNIDKVSTFLKSTRAQYILTTPITHNSNIYAPASVILVTQKVKPKQSFAPPIIKAVRRSDVGAPAQ